MAKENLSKANQTWARVQEAAIRLFYEHGYEGTALRDIATAVGMKAGSLYYHLSTKQDLLFRIIDRTMDYLIKGAEDAVGAANTPEQQLSLLVRHHIYVHGQRPYEVFLTNSELRALTPDNRAQIVSKRDRYERIIQQILQQGVETGVFVVPDEKLVSYAILALCTGVAQWYRPEGRLSLDNIANTYSHLVLSSLYPRPSGAAQ